MMTHLSSRERVGYLGLVALVLFGFGFMGIRQFENKPEIKVQPLQAVQAPTPDAAPAEVVVHVVGAVKKPGMVRLGAGKRVQDALADRGGPEANADLEAINLAAKLEDGTQLLVPAKGKVEPEKIATAYRGGGSDVYRIQPVASSGGSSSKDPAPKSISLNSASQAQFESLPGIGPATAKKILDYRQSHGGFSSIDELLAVKGIGPKKLEAMRPFLKL